jgi:hypothetical protein
VSAEKNTHPTGNKKAKLELNNGSSLSRLYQEEIVEV